VWYSRNSSCSGSHRKNSSSNPRGLLQKWCCSSSSSRWCSAYWWTKPTKTRISCFSHSSTTRPSTSATIVKIGRARWSFVTHCSKITGSATGFATKSETTSLISRGDKPQSQISPSLLTFRPSPSCHRKKIKISLSHPIGLSRTCPRICLGPYPGN